MLFLVELNINMFCDSIFSYTIDIRRCRIVYNDCLGTKWYFSCRIVFNKILFLVELKRNCLFYHLLCTGTTEYFLDRIYYSTWIWTSLNKRIYNSSKLEKYWPYLIRNLRNAHLVKYLLAERLSTFLSSAELGNFALHTIKIQLEMFEIWAIAL